MDVTSETMPPDVEQAEDDGDPVFSISVSSCELDRTWHNASQCIPSDILTVDAIAEALIQCVVGVAAARGGTTLLALQHRLLNWGNES